MAISLGIDTGGTFTDAVIIDNDKVVDSGKSLTTRDNLGVGIRNALAAVVTRDNAASISRVSLSTTLATNAMVEGHGRPAALVMIGQPDGLLNRSRLNIAIGDDPVIQIAGGHSAYGDEQTELDEDALIQSAQRHAPSVSGFAVAAYFAVRNPSHEQRARTLIESVCDAPVTCSHELSARLDAPRRALTALLNARLVPLLSELIVAVNETMAALSIDAPLMIVQGDGSLVLADTALTRPVETILSGPAASVMGAHWLCGLDDALISDMGGTTTDIARLEAGQPQRNDDGARVGGWHTMVEAIAVHTHALGGDSEITVSEDDQLTLGPQRAVPVSLVAYEHPDTLALLQAQANSMVSVWDGKFAQRIRPDEEPAGLTRLDDALLNALGEHPVTLAKLLEDPRLERPLARLRQRGIIAISQFTPSDALHVLGRHDLWCSQAARIAARLMLRPRHAEVTESMVDTFCHRVVNEVTLATGVLLTEAALVSDANLSLPPNSSGRWLIDQALRQNNSLLLQPKIHLRSPIVGIGAPAHAYYPPLAKSLGTEVQVPDGASVCNAIGAAISGVVRRAMCTVTSPADGLFRVHADFGIADFTTRASARDYALAGVESAALALARNAGCQHPKVEIREAYDIATAHDGSELFVEGRITATAHGD